VEVVEMRFLLLLIPGLTPQEIQHWVAPATAHGRGMLKGVRVLLVQYFPGTCVFEQEVQIAGYAALSLRSRVLLNGLSGRFDYSGTPRTNQLTRELSPGLLKAELQPAEPLPVFR
jgi:hypothetical protein